MLRQYAGIMDDQMSLKNSLSQGINISLCNISNGPNKHSGVMSEKIKVRILTEGSQKAGMGHITRCLSLCQAFIVRGIDPIFIVNGDMKIDSLMSGQKYEIFD